VLKTTSGLLKWFLSLTLANFFICCDIISNIGRTSEWPNLKAAVAKEL
jgi:hypothetical protein